MLGFFLSVFVRDELTVDLSQLYSSYPFSTLSVAASPNGFLMAFVSFLQLRGLVHFIAPLAKSPFFDNLSSAVCMSPTGAS